MSDSQRVGRLAMRHEGKFWNAYYAMPESMENAILLGSIAVRFVQTEERRNAFMLFMREAMADLIEETVGVRPTFPDGPMPAPETERSGHA